METENISQVLKIPTGGSQIAHKHGLIVSVRDWDSSSATLVYGSPGSLNSQRTFYIGDAALYETPTHGLIELRLLSRPSGEAEVIFTKVSPRLGFGTTIDSQDSENQNFAQDEILQIKNGIEAIRIAFSSRQDVSEEQFELLSKKLDEIATASERLGRKDWIMFVIGNLTNFAMGAALAPEAAKALITAFNSNLGWVFQNALRLLGAS